MEKNYYDILQINKNASPKIIEKAYKVLAKEYHPDLQSDNDKKQAEEILKQINEAYEVLSDPIKRQEYDKTLNDISDDIYTKRNIEEELNRQKEEIELENQLQKQMQAEKQQRLEYERQLQYEKELQNAKQKAYYDAYIQDLKNRGYKIRYKKSLKDYIKLFFILFILFFIIILIIQLPFVKNYFINLYNENEIIHLLVSPFINI